jgi:dTDP-4-dehydrorhamnose reductase
MKIMVVGAAGQVGKDIVELAFKLNINIVAYPRETLDITDLSAVQEAVASHPDLTCLINAAAYTAVDLAEDNVEQAYAINADAVENLAIVCQQYDIPLIHLSTDYVFSGEKSEPYNEEDETGAKSIYGASKLEGEQIIQSIMEKYIILRVSWVFGQYGKNFVKTIIRLAKEREELSIVADQWGNPTAAADIARVLLQLAEQIQQGNTAWGIYHYCGDGAVSWYQFAEKIVELEKMKTSLKLQSLLPITSDKYPTKALRPMNSRLNCDKIRQNFAIEQRSWLEYLKTICEETSETPI